MPLSLEQLPAPVYFVIRNREYWADVFSRIDDPPKIEEIAPRFGSDPAPTWVLQAYLQLLQRGLDVHLSSSLVPGQICVLGMWQIPRRELIGRSYCVVVRADCCSPAVADQVIVQNPLNVRSKRDHLIHHWPQPGLIPRDPRRGNRLENLVFKGTPDNLWLPLQQEKFRQKLSSLGVNFMFDAKATSEEIVASWSDYQDADLVIAMRDLTEYDAQIKPATKLTNAWLAGCPALLGPEPAYQALKVDCRDYIEVRSVEDVLNAIRCLKQQPELYSDMLKRTHERAVEFSADAIAQDWRDLLSGSIYQGYRSWAKKSHFFRNGLAILQQPSKIMRHRNTLKRYLRERNKGPRILKDH